MGAIVSLFSKKEERVEATCGARIVNIFKHSYPGIVSFVLIFVLMGAFFEPIAASPSTLRGVWLVVLAFFLLRPMAPSATGLIPVFACPMLGLLSSDSCCTSLINENVVLFFLGSWLLLLVNNCGLDKRLACAFLKSSQAKSYTPRNLMLKSCMAAFFISAIAEREMTTQAIMKYVIGALEPLQKINGEANYAELKTVIMNAIAVSSTLGSSIIVHASLTTIQMRSLFSEAAPDSWEFPDVFNYQSYSAYAFPTFISMFLLNTGYEMVMAARTTNKGKISVKSMEHLHKAFKKYHQDLGPMTNHEKISIFFLVAMMICFYTRWSKWLNYGWATFRRYPDTELCAIKDATIAAIFAVILHFLPKSIHFTKICRAKKNKDFPVMKAESGILFWKFIDKNTDYSLLFLFGTGAILFKAMVVTGCSVDIKYFIGDKITELDFNVGILFVVALSVLFSNLMTGMAAQAILMPFFLGLAHSGQGEWPLRQHLVVMGVGLGTSFGFCYPFKHTPSYYVKNVGKVRFTKQLLLSLPSVIICTLILWLTLCFFALYLWDPALEGILPQRVPGTGETTPAEAATPAPPPAL